MRSRLRLRDAFALGAVGLRARRVRSALSALGIAVAIAALVAVLGIAASAKADLLAQLGAEGNLLTLAAGQTFTGNPTPLPATAEQMIKAVPPVREVTAVSVVQQATVRRSAAIPVIQIGGISVLAAEPSLLETLSATMLRGHFLDSIAQRYPEVVLGYSAAQNLGVGTLSAATQVYLGGNYFVVVGILTQVSVAPEIDDAALVSFPVAVSRLTSTTVRPGYTCERTQTRWPPSRRCCHSPRRPPSPRPSRCAGRLTFSSPGSQPGRRSSACFWDWVR